MRNDTVPERVIEIFEPKPPLFKIQHGDTFEIVKPQITGPDNNLLFVPCRNMETNLETLHWLDKYQLRRILKYMEDNEVYRNSR